jgi:hypothetical protein
MFPVKSQKESGGNLRYSNSNSATFLALEIKKKRENIS